MDIHKLLATRPFLSVTLPCQYSSLLSFDIPYRVYTYDEGGYFILFALEGTLLSLSDGVR